MSTPVQHGTTIHFSIIPHWVLEMSSHAVKLYVVLMKYADNQPPFLAYPSRSRLAKDMSFSQPRSVDKYVAELEAGGAVRVERKMVDGKNEVNRYWMNRSDVPWGGAVQRTTPALEDDGVVQSSADSGAVERTTVVRQAAQELDPMNYTQELEALIPSESVTAPEKEAKISFPEDLVLTSAMREVAKKKPGLDAGLTFAKYRLYWLNKPKVKRTMSSWVGATWRNWVASENVPPWVQAEQSAIERERQRYAPPPVTDPALAKQMAEWRGEA